jgi:hypothetical protein
MKSWNISGRGVTSSFWRTLSRPAYGYRDSRSASRHAFSASWSCGKSGVQLVVAAADRFKELAGELARCCVDVAVALERALEVLEAGSRTHHDQTKAQ